MPVLLLSALSAGPDRRHSRHHGQLYCYAQLRCRAPLPGLLHLARGRASSSALPAVTGGKDWEEDVVPFSLLSHDIREKRRWQRSRSHAPQGPLTCIPANKVGSTVLPRRGAEPTFSSAAVGAEQCQFSQSRDLRVSSPTCHP